MTNPKHDPFSTLSDGGESPSDRLGSYVIIRPIDGGGMGQVYEARREGSQDSIALKVIRCREGQRIGPKAKKMFLREMAILSRLKHPRIVRLIDFGTAEDQWFLAMEYVRTIDLLPELRLCSNAQQIRLVSGIGCYLLEALTYIHSQQIVHRDIKPSNILVYRNQANKIGVKLADFGISKDIRDAGWSGMTRLGEMRGTPAFMPIEQLLNSRDASFASDLYSVSGALYYYLTGHSPHQIDGMSAADQLVHIVETPSIPIGQHRPDLPDDFCRIIDLGLRRIGEGRYATAVEMNQALLPFSIKR